MDGLRWILFGEKPAFSSIGYTGHVHDDDLGFINMNGRLYDTEQQRFISRDPVLLPDALGGTNAYSYVLNDPMNLTDPSGFRACRDGVDDLGDCYAEETVSADGNWDEMCAEFPEIPECQGRSSSNLVNCVDIPGCTFGLPDEAIDRGEEGGGSSLPASGCGKWGCVLTVDGWVARTRPSHVPPPFGGTVPTECKTNACRGVPKADISNGLFFGDAVSDPPPGSSTDEPPNVAADIVEILKEFKADLTSTPSNVMGAPPMDVIGAVIDPYIGLFERFSNQTPTPDVLYGVVVPGAGSGQKPSLSAHKDALRQVHRELGGSLPPGKPGKFGSPQRGTPTRGYRLDPPHPGHSPTDPEAGYHLNWYDYTGKKRRSGGRHGVVPIK